MSERSEREVVEQNHGQVLAPSMVLCRSGSEAGALVLSRSTTNHLSKVVEKDKIRFQ
jgi:hypothetical protein